MANFAKNQELFLADSRGIIKKVIFKWLIPGNPVLSTVENDRGDHQTITTKRLFLTPEEALRDHEAEKGKPAEGLSQAQIERLMWATGGSSQGNAGGGPPVGDIGDGYRK